MYDFIRGISLRQPAEVTAYLNGANGQNCPTNTLAELAAWFQGFATYARRTRG